MSRDFTTKPRPDQPGRCPSIDPHDTLQCTRAIHDDDQCQAGGIAWRKGSPRIEWDRERADRLQEEIEEYDAILTRQSDLLTRTVNALRGNPPPLTSWSHHDIPELAAEKVAEVARLTKWTDLDVRAVDTVRILAADSVQKVGNGHPGTAISLAPVAYLLYQNVMRHDPSDPTWLGRDRFVLSCGHSSLTQYIQLFLSGYGLQLADLKALRTWGSQTPGHPEVHHTTGVETAERDALIAVGKRQAARLARVEALAEEWDGDDSCDNRTCVPHRSADALRAALAGSEADTSDTQSTDQEDQ